MEEIMAMGRSVVEDEIEAGEIIQEGSNKRNLLRQITTINRTDRERLNGHKGGVLWFTGLSGSGKSTLANMVEKRLNELGIRSYLLDGDNVRYGLNQDLGFSKVDRSENIRRIAEVSKLFMDAGIIVLSAFISPYKANRQLAREIISNGKFLEIFIQCPLEECERRDPKGLYAKARKGEISQFTGISDPYEAPDNPDIIVFSEKESVEESAERILEYLKLRNLI
jgi:adenylyl-sulfate kinase